MGTSGGDGGGWPPDGGGPPDDLPELPPEWRSLVVPDDPAALADEAAAVRRELRRQRRAARRQRLRRPSRAGRGGPRLTYIILVIAVLVTLASLFAAPWQGRPRPQVPPRTTGTGTTTGTTGWELPALELVAADGGTVPLRGTLPVVILLIDGCRCTDLIVATAQARTDLAVLTVTAGRAAPGFSPPASTPVPVRVPGAQVRHLIDPTGELRASLKLGPPDGAAAVVLVSDTGLIDRVVASTTSVGDFQRELARL